MSKNVNRREFLKFGGSALALAVLPPTPNALPPDERSIQVESRLGRVTTARAWVHSGPNPHSPRVGLRRYDDIVHILQEVQRVGYYDHNHVWYKLAGGYIYSSWVQPVAYRLNRPVAHIKESGLLAWVTVPYTESRLQPDFNLARRYRLYYDSIFRVVDAHISDDSPRRVWYAVREGLAWNGVNWVPAEHLRIIPPHEMTPLSPEVEDKRIVVELNKQWMTCFEGQKAVFETRIASGMPGLITPLGKHRVLQKAPTEHMAGGQGRNRYNLPGVGFVTYFTAKGVAFHGTYWHNDYGQRRSHGCVNVPTPAAQWIYRWTRPDAPHSTARVFARESDATRIEVVA